ncbi:hypothetical protein M422DRAFT_276277 [Sphaerobolus stellatus SS14]|uniref:Uncharacterized protein n=1 Tax=Sphaerobolus stellatus (strain SS14) TaxID=990650 RepID=A0A0C9T2Y8_SPHS4|nr:hypothetical protein M422DRAFT_276277 [Sphaerobolus stellatus SS14]
MASRSVNTTGSSSNVLPELLKAVDEETIKAYRAKVMLLPLSDVMESCPIPNDSQTYAYIVDLTASTTEFKDSDREYLLMSSIIKNVCTDGWEGSTGGYKN